MKTVKNGVVQVCNEIGWDAKDSRIQELLSKKYDLQTTVKSVSVYKSLLRPRKTEKTQVTLAMLQDVEDFVKKHGALELLEAAIGKYRMLFD